MTQLEMTFSDAPKDGEARAAAARKAERAKLRAWRKQEAARRRRELDEEDRLRRAQAADRTATIYVFPTGIRTVRAGRR